MGKGTELKNRKTDRRTLYTKNVIKDALLEALEDKNFEQITVTDVCRRAEITRATYYLHYQSLTEVLDELLGDALQMAEEDCENPAYTQRRRLTPCRAPVRRAHWQRAPSPAYR